ncbi:hypothetical protein HAX54_049907 [Datura stramonium]|uniref:Uncharacterized protein n=1 Tax=Datura stramonium TaxID=4076 RepID=A0ABS8SWH3_DATST|nr:hypothetical protein [Datura stramonium]
MDSGNKKDAKKAFTRPRLVGHSVFGSNSGYICAEQKRPTSKIIKSRPLQKMTSSSLVTNDLGYAPTKGLKWKEKTAITGSQLQHKSALVRYMKSKIQTSSQGATRDV